MVVYGGYGLDFYFGKISRDHGDIDLVIYGQDSRINAARLIKEYLEKNIIKPDISISENDYQLVVDVHAKGFTLNLYYIQTQDKPYYNLHSVIKKSGEVAHNDPKMFPPPQQGRHEGSTFEVQDQLSHLSDILAKNGQNNPKYRNDIELLNTLSSST